MNMQRNLTWDTGTAYDFMVSLILLHDPKNYGLRAKWARAIRQRLPEQSRDLLEQLMASQVITPNLYWLYENLSDPKDAQTLITTLHGMPPLKSVAGLLGLEEEDNAYTAFVREIIQRGSWTEEDFMALKRIIKEKNRSKPEAKLRKMLTFWANSVKQHSEIMAALQAYQDVFFSSEEQRIATAQQKGLADAQRLAKELPFNEFFEIVSEGIVYDEDRFADADEIVLAPSFWTSPFVFMSLLDPPFFLFGVRPDDTSLVPGEAIPDALIKSLHAVSDPTRLRIMRYLEGESLTQTQLALRLKLRTSTVAHHLKNLRAAGLVNIQFSVGNKKEVFYSTRTERLDGVCKMLSDFVKQSDGGKKP